MPFFENKGFQRLPTQEDNEEGTNQAPPQAPPYQPHSYYDDSNRTPQAWTPATQHVVAPLVQTMGFMQEQRPTDWTIPAVLGCIFCCWPIGIFAIIYANKATTFSSVGNMVEARRNARIAKILTIASLVTGLLISVIIPLAIVIPMEKLAHDLQDNLNDNLKDSFNNDDRMTSAPARWR